MCGGLGRNAGCIGRKQRRSLGGWGVEEYGQGRAADVLGHSAGGFIALQLAQRRPGLASGLILCDSAATLAAVPDDTEAGTRPACAVGCPAGARSLFSGSFSAERMAAFEQLVMPYYAGPEH